MIIGVKRHIFVGGINQTFSLQKNARLYSINNSLEEKVSFSFSALFFQSLLACSVPTIAKNPPVM